MTQRARPAAHFKTYQLAKHKSQLHETDLFPFFFVLFSWGALTLLLSRPSVPKERESSAVSVSTLELTECGVLGGGGGDHMGFWGWGRVCHDTGPSVGEAVISPGFPPIIWQTSSFK